MINKPPTIAVVAGTRPEVIKMAPVYFALKNSEFFEPLWLSTAQHREMLDQALNVFGIEPDHDLDLMQPGQSLGDLTARVISAVGEFLKSEKPAAILVQGDTTTVLGSSLAAFYERVPIAHVEAGLRTGDLASPFPEEMNRRLTDPLCEWCFAPTKQSAANLIAEQIPASRVHITGNSVIDALFWVRNKLSAAGVSPWDVCAKTGIPDNFRDRYLDPDTDKAAGAKWILVTGHRRESFGSGFEHICQSIRELVDQHPDLGVLYPVHLNPQVQAPVKRILGNHGRIALIGPVAYEEFIWLMDRCYFVLSDSGGVQEEAPSLGKPVLVMRDTTERPEGIDAGTCRLVGTDSRRILNEARLLLADANEYARRSSISNPYGDGKSANRIVTTLANALCAC